jgi:hypothetical protein
MIRSLIIFQMPRIYFRGIWFFRYFSYICYDIKPLPKTMQAFKGTHGFYLVWELKAAAFSSRRTQLVCMSHQLQILI